MKTELPLPAEILEELAEKVLVQIDRLSTTAFASALDEMIEYHRFLLEAYGSRTREGVSFSYAEISDWIEPPHQSWMRQYRRLFERAAFHIDEDPDLISTLARTPIRLIEGLAPNSSAAITGSVLDLGLILVGRLENWLTQRVSRKSSSFPEGSQSVELRGSDKTAFKDVIIDVVGAWERLIQFAPSMFGFNELKAANSTRQWYEISRSFPFFRHHLRNTAYFLAAATWNEDEIGAAYFEEALVRWTDSFDYALPDDFYGMRRLLLFPSLVETDWKTATDQIREIEGSASPFPIEPFPTFKVLLHGMHTDVILITAAVLLRWYIEGKQNSETLLKVVSRLLIKRATDEDEIRKQSLPGFKSLFLQIVRMEAAGQRLSRASYGSTLDELAAFLDQMSERDVVSGRIFTPSTIHDRDGLRLSILTLLLATLKQNVQESLVKEIDALAMNEKGFIQGDRTLADLIAFFDRMAETLISNQDRLGVATRYLSPELNVESAVIQLEGLFKEASGVIQRRRTERLKSRRVEPSAVERIRKRAEDAMLIYPAGVQVFEGFEILRDSHFLPEFLRETRVNKLPKGVFTSPAMAWNWMDLDESILSGIGLWIARLVDVDFWSRKRSISRTRHEFGSPQFWKLLRKLKQQVGPRPSLLLSTQDQIRMVLGWTHQLEKAPTSNVKMRPKSERGTRYLASVDEIDIYGGSSKIGPLVFSGKALKSITYHPVDEAYHAISLHDVVDEDPWQFSLVTRISQQLVWSDEPIFEIQFLAT